MARFRPGAGRRTAGNRCQAARSISAARRLVVHLEGHRERGVSGQPEPAHLAVQAQRAGGAHGVVVEAAGHRDAAHGLGELEGGLLSRAPPGPRPPAAGRRTRPAAPGSARSRRPPAAPPPPAGPRARPRTARSRRRGRAPRRWPVPAPRRRGAAVARRARHGRRRSGRAGGPGARPSSSGTALRRGGRRGSRSGLRSRAARLVPAPPAAVHGAAPGRGSGRAVPRAPEGVHSPPSA